MHCNLKDVGSIPSVIAEIFVRVNISYPGVRNLSYAINFHTVTVVSHTLVYMHGLRMLLNFVLAAKSTKYAKLYRVRTFLWLQYLNLTDSEVNSYVYFIEKKGWPGYSRVVDWIARTCNGPFAQLLPGLETGHPVTVGQSPAYDFSVSDEQKAVFLVSVSDCSECDSCASDWPTVTGCPVSNPG